MFTTNVLKFQITCKESLLKSYMCSLINASCESLLYYNTLWNFLSMFKVLLRDNYVSFNMCWFYLECVLSNKIVEEVNQIFVIIASQEITR